MKILVCISKVPDTTAKISFKDNGTKFNEDKVQFIINPYDEWYALVRAIELKESNGGTGTVVNVGPVENEQYIRKALALGADGVLIGRPFSHYAIGGQAEGVKLYADKLINELKECMRMTGSKTLEDIKRSYVRVHF